MTDIYDNWKPLRNYLANVDIVDSLYVIWAYALREIVNTPPPWPADIQPHPMINKPHTFLAWELETLAREVIISGRHNKSPKYSFKNARHFGNAINLLKAIEESIGKKYINQQNILREVSVRLAHRQFKYSTDRPNLESLIRYSKIFNHSLVAPLIEQKTGLSPKQISIIGGATFGNSINNFFTKYTLDKLELPGVTVADYEKFMSYFSLPIDDLRELLVDPSERHMDERFFYGYHSLFSYPILKTATPAGLTVTICPLLILMHWRITSGLYYDICHMKGFDNAFGPAFESYVGTMLTKTLDGGLADVYPGEANTASSPSRSDWVIDFSHECLLVESKTKRLTMGAKTSLFENDELYIQLNILGEAIKQSYLSLDAYRKAAYKNPIYILASDKKTYICVTTLEQWHLMGDQAVLLHAIVKKKLAEVGLPVSIINDSPYFVVPIADLESVAFLSKTHQLSDIIEPFIDEVRGVHLEFGVYLNNHFHNDLLNYKYVFYDELDNVYSVDLEKKSQRRNPPISHTKT